jgi:hypothetical protein
MAVSSIAEELQGKKRTYSMGCGDHLGAWKTCLIEDLIERYLTEVGEEEKEATELSFKLPGTEIHPTHIGHRRNLGPYARRFLIIAPPG